MATSFGSAFAPRMGICHFRDGAWTSPELVPVEPLALHPGAHVLHYGSACFEGLKAYRFEDGSAHIFRLDRHIERMRASAGHLCLPVPDVALLDGIVREVVKASADIIPPSPGALYLRPVLIGTEPNIGAATRPSNQALLYVLASPVGDYFEGGGRPLKLVIEDARMRSTPQMGQVKTGGNYAAAVRQITDAKKKYQADQVLFCPGGDVQETGAANFLLLADGKILTKRLDGSVLPGITRDSLLKLAAGDGYQVEERDFDLAELLEWIKTGEAALSGTAAVLAAVGSLVHQEREIPVGDGKTGPNTARLRERLTRIQSGRDPDPFGWHTAV